MQMFVFDDDFLFTLRMPGTTMLSVKYRLGLALSLICLSVSSITHATVMTSGCAVATSCSLDELFAGGTISVDDVSFSNWQDTLNFFYELDDSLNDVNGSLDLTQIYVSGIDAVSTGNLNEFTLGLAFYSLTSWDLPIVSQALEEAELEQTIDYQVSASNGTMISAVQLDLGETALRSEDSYVEVNLDSSLPFALQVYQEFIDPDLDEVLTDSQVFAVAQSAFDMTSNIQMGTFVPGEVGLYGFNVMLTVMLDNTQPPPVPASAPASIPLILFGMGLLIHRRKRLNKH